MSAFRLPNITMQVQIPAEQIAAAIVLHEEELSALIQTGVRRAVEGAAEEIITKAQSQAGEAINSAIEGYFSYGKGREAIEAAVTPVLEQLVDRILGPKRGGKA